MNRPPVSFVVPVRNGERWIRDVLAGIARQRDGRAIETILVDDGCEDRTIDIVRDVDPPDLRIIAGYKRGAAAAVNAGIRAARFPIICQIDQDVVLHGGWLDRLVSALDDPAVAAAQGCYTADDRAGIAAQVMGFDLEQRYDALRGGRTTHVCTGNSAYRAEALQNVGLFDEELGYGYDNDMSYRLQHAGYRLVFCRDARSTHRWREGLGGYFSQQYGFGYGRLDVVARHRERLAGDTVSPLGMMLHPVVLTVALLAASAALLLAVAGSPALPTLLVAAVLIGGLVVERSIAGVRAAVRFRSATPLLFPVFHLLRDFAWVAAIATWTVRRLKGRASQPSDSMSVRVVDPQLVRRSPAHRARQPVVPTRLLGLIPAHNEAASLAGVVADIRACAPDLDLLVIDDGSTDDTPDVVDALGVRWMRLPERMGVGSAMRAGLRYAARQGYDAAVRLDGDGQHRASDIRLMLAPLREARADVVFGSRFTTSDADSSLAARRVVQRLLGVCLTALTGRRVTDATSGFWAIGPRALRLLAEHHPTGYPEPELRLFLDRNGLQAVEVPVHAQSRQGGRTSLTPFRITAAGARFLLAMIVVPFREGVGRHDRD